MARTLKDRLAGPVNVATLVSTILSIALALAALSAPVAAKLDEASHLRAELAEHKAQPFHSGAADLLKQLSAQVQHLDTTAARLEAQTDGLRQDLNAEREERRLMQHH